MRSTWFTRGLCAPFRVVPFILASIIQIPPATPAALGPCALPDLPSCACFSDCSDVGAPWPPFFGDIVEVARRTAGLQSCCIQHGGQAYWQVQRQATNAPCAEALAFQDPNIQANDATDPEAWCTETIAYWGARSSTPYAMGYATERHHPGSYVRNTKEMRLWYIDEEAVGGIYRGRWIDGTELDYANFVPGVNGPCPGAYQQIYKYDPADADGDGTYWDKAGSHSQLIDSMVVYRLGDANGPAQRIDVHMVEGNVGFGGEGFARVINSRWYRDILPFTALGPDETVLDGGNRKIRGWGVNLNSDGTVDYDPGRIRTEVTFYAVAHPVPIGSENSDASHVAQMLTYYTATGGGLDVTSNSPQVQTGGKLPSPANPWLIPPPPHPVDPVCIDVDLRAQHPNLVRGVVIDWMDAVPPYFEVWWSGIPVNIHKRFVTVPGGGPPVPPGTQIPMQVVFTPGTTDVGHPVRYLRLCIPLASLTRLYTIRGLHYDFWFDEVEDNNGSSPDGDAIATAVGSGRAPSPLWLSEGAPNPSGGSVSLTFDLPSAGEAVLDIYDVMGRRVHTLLTGRQAGGPRTVVWDGRDETGRRLPSGVYFARLEWKGNVVTKKLVLLR